MKNYFSKISKILIISLLFLNVRMCFGNIYYSLPFRSTEGFIIVGESHIALSSTAFIKYWNDEYIRYVPKENIDEFDNWPKETNIFFVTGVQNESCVYLDFGLTDAMVKIDYIMKERTDITHFNILFAQGTGPLATNYRYFKASSFSEADAIEYAASKSATEYFDILWEYQKKYTNADIYYVCIPPCDEDYMIKYMSVSNNNAAVYAFNEKIKSIWSKTLDYTNLYEASIPAMRIINRIDDDWILDKPLWDGLHWTFSVYFRVFSTAIYQTMTEKVEFFNPNLEYF